MMTRLLILTPQLPYPPHQGTSLRNYHIILGLSQRHQITLVSFREPEQSDAPGEIKPLLDLCDEVVVVEAPFRSRRQRLLQLFTTLKPDISLRLESRDMAATLATLLQQTKFDIIQIEGLEMASTIDQLRASNPLAKLVYDSHNAESALQRRALFTDLPTPRRWLAAAYSWLQIDRIRRFERKVCRSVDQVTVVSDADRQSLESILQPHPKAIEVVPNCIDVGKYYDGLGRSMGAVATPVNSSVGLEVFDVVFTGKMDYRPNVDAVLWFADSIWPRILAERPAATWAIVGQKVHSRLKRLAGLEGVTVTGRVEHVQPYLAGAGVYVMPFRIGGGTRLKLLEAMASGNAIVSTRIGAEGYGAIHGRELYLAESEHEFASAVLHLLAHPDDRGRLRLAALEFAQQYDWRRVIPRFDDIYDQLV